jgi:hypothetical protein
VGDVEGRRERNRTHHKLSVRKQDCSCVKEIFDGCVEGRKKSNSP